MAAAQPAECNIKVFCRFRPLNESEGKNGSTFIAKFLSDSCCTVEEKMYSYDRIFQPSIPQQTIYDIAAKPLINNVLSGYNGTIFAYGQTSSGKTYTMEGVVGDPVFQGIIPRTVDDIFAQIAAADSSVRFCIKERIRDLLNASKRDLEIREDRFRVPYVKGCTEREVTNAEEMMAAIEEGKAIREFSRTNMNDNSSRSHSVFLITITQEQSVRQKKLTGKLCLVDLAGSEKVSKTGADGKQLEEAKRINSSLSVLRKVIFALSNGDVFIPYRESKLTRVLQESLGGNAKTTVIVCCSPASYNLEETKSTLQFGVSAKTIKNVVKVNEELSVDEWKRLVEKERAMGRQRDWVIGAAIKELDKWRQGDYVPRSEWLDFAKLIQEGQIADGTITAPTPDVILPAVDAAPVDTEENQECEEAPMPKNNEEWSPSLVAEKALLLTKLAQAECEKDLVKTRVDEIREQLNAVLEAMDTCTPDEAPFIDNPVADRLRAIRHRLDSLHKNEDDFPSEEDGLKDEEQESEDAKLITCRQEDVSRQMEVLLEQIKQKEQLITQTVANAENIEKMRHIYEVEINELRQKIEGLERERDNIQLQATRQSNASKISEARRIRLQEVEKQLAECRRKVQDLQKLEKMKAQNDERIKTLRSELEGMKASRVKLMRQMKEDNERFRKAQVKVEQQMNQIRQEGKRQQYEAAKAKQNMDRQLAVHRRKYEEATAVNKRLQQQLEKQKSVQKDRFASIKENGRLVQELKEYLKDEVALQVSAEEGRNLLTQLEQQREELKEQLQKLQRERKALKNAMDRGPPKKRQNRGDGEKNSEHRAEQLERINLEISAMGEEMQNRETQIGQMKERIRTFDVEGREGHRWTHIHTMVHAQCSLKLLFDMVVSAVIEKMTVCHRLDDAESKNADMAANLLRLEKQLEEESRQCDEMIKQHTEAWHRSEREHQHQVSYLLRQVLKAANDCQLGETEMENLMEICDKMASVENLSQQLERKETEAKKLSQELSKAKVRANGSRKFFDSVERQEPERVEINDENEEENGNEQQSRRSRQRRVPQRYGKIVDSTIAIFDPDSPAVGTRHRKTLSNTSRKSKLGDTTRDSMCALDKTAGDGPGMEQCLRNGGQADIDMRESGDESDGDRTFVVCQPDMTRGQSKMKPNALQSLDVNGGVGEEQESDTLNEEQPKIPLSPLANMGISKPRTPHGSLFTPGVGKPKFFQ